MVRASGLYVNGFLLEKLDEEPDEFLPAVFRDEMYQRQQERLHEYWDDDVDPEEIDAEVTTHQYIAQGRVIKERLDMLGIYAHNVIYGLRIKISRNIESFKRMSHGDLVKSSTRQHIYANLERMNGFTAELWMNEVNPSASRRGRTSIR